MKKAHDLEKEYLRKRDQVDEQLASGIMKIINVNQADQVASSENKKPANPLADGSTEKPSIFGSNDEKDKPKQSGLFGGEGNIFNGKRKKMNNIEQGMRSKF